MIVVKTRTADPPPETHFDFETPTIHIFECAEEREGVQKIVPPLRIVNFQESDFVPVDLIYKSDRLLNMHALVLVKAFGNQWGETKAFKWSIQTFKCTYDAQKCV